MRKLAGSVLIALISMMPCFALENCIITSSNPVVFVENKSPRNFTVKILDTIMNERDTLILQALSVGEGEFTLKTENGKVSKFRVVIKGDVTEISTESSSFEYFVLDDIPEEYELDLPPEVKWNK